MRNLMHTMNEYQEPRKIAKQSTKGREQNGPVKATFHVLINELRCRGWAKMDFKREIKT